MSDVFHILYCITYLCQVLLKKFLTLSRINSPPTTEVYCSLVDEYEVVNGDT